MLIFRWSDPGNFKPAEMLKVKNVTVSDYGETQMIASRDHKSLKTDSSYEYHRPIQCG